MENILATLVFKEGALLVLICVEKKFFLIEVSGVTPEQFGLVQDILLIKTDVGFYRLLGDPVSVY